MAHYLSMQVCKLCVCDATFILKYWSLNVGVLRKQNQVVCVLVNCRLLLGVYKLNYMIKRRESVYSRLLRCVPRTYFLCIIRSLLKKHMKYVNINL